MKKISIWSRSAMVGAVVAGVMGAGAGVANASQAQALPASSRDFDRAGTGKPKYFRRILSALIMTIGLALIASQASMAASARPTVPASPTAGLTAAQFNQAIKELKESPLKRSVVTTTIDTRTTFDLPEGFTMTVVEPKKATAGIQPRIGGGTDGGGVYVLFNQWDQDMLYMGSGALLGAALCAIPGVGWLACLGVSLLVGAATTAVANSGKCTNNRQLKIYVSTLYSSCV